MAQFEDSTQRDIRSKKMSESWATGVIPYSVNCNINESKAERKIYNILNTLFKNVEKKTIRIDGKYYFPDIIIDNKIIIEYYGDYWHTHPLKYDELFVVKRVKKRAKEIREYDINRIGEFENNGYIVFVIWEYDYKNNKQYIINQLISNIEKVL